MLSFIVTVGSAITAPAWQAVVPQLVPKSELRPRIAANSVGINVSRAVGPALGGFLSPRRRDCGAVLGQCIQ